MLTSLICLAFAAGVVFSAEEKEHFQQTIPLYSTDGARAAYLYAGTPPQKQSVILQTSSNLIAFACGNCKKCGNHIDPFFNLTVSKTTEVVPCEKNGLVKCKKCSKNKGCIVEKSYEDGSWRALMLKDTLFLGKNNSKPEELYTSNNTNSSMMFGCQYKETGMFSTQKANGVMGLSRSATSFISQLFVNDVIDSRVFSLCFSKNGGKMTIGAPDASFHEEKIKFAQAYPSHEHNFIVKITDIRIGKKTIVPKSKSLKPKKMTIDSGTTNTYLHLPSVVRKDFSKKFRIATGLHYQAIGDEGDCGEGYDEHEVKKLPSISIVLQAATNNQKDRHMTENAGAFDVAPNERRIKLNDVATDINENDRDDEDDVVIEVTPENYLVKVGKVYCSAIIFSKHGGSVFGINSMLNHDLVFDPVNHQVGFAKAKCPGERADNIDKNTVLKTTTSDATSNDDLELPAEFAIAGGVVLFAVILFVFCGSFIWCVKLRRKRKWEEVEKNSTKNQSDSVEVGGESNGDEKAVKSKRKKISEIKLEEIVELKEEEEESETILVGTGAVLTTGITPKVIKLNDLEDVELDKSK